MVERTYIERSGTDVEKVTVGANITTIGVGAFNDAASLKSIVFKAANVTKIYKGAFDGIAEDAVIKITASSKKEYNRLVRSLIPATYAYQIFEGRKNCGRDKLLRIALAFPLSIADTNRLLSVGGFNDLYVRNKRDAIVLYCLEKKIGVVDANILLSDSGEEIL